MDLMDESENLTDLGWLLLDIDLEPHFGKMLVYGVLLQCLDPILTIVSWVTNGDPFRIPPSQSQKKLMYDKNLRLSQNSHSDLVVYLHLFQEYLKSVSERNEYRWCDLNNIAQSVIQNVEHTRKQILNQLIKSEVYDKNWAEANKNSCNWIVVRVAITAGLYPNIVKKENSKFRSEYEPVVQFHQSSVLKCLNSKNNSNNMYTENTKGTVEAAEWAVFEDLQIVDKTVRARSCTAVGPIAICLFAGPSKLPEKSLVPIDKTNSPEDETKPKPTLVKVYFDKWLHIIMEESDAITILKFREEMAKVFLKKLKTPKLPLSDEENKILETVVHALIMEEKLCKFTRPILPEPNSTPPLGTETKADFAAKSGEVSCYSGYRAQRGNSSKTNFKFNYARRETEDRADSFKQSSWQEMPSTSCFDKHQDSFPKSYKPSYSRYGYKTNRDEAEGYSHDSSGMLGYEGASSEQVDSQQSRNQNLQSHELHRGRGRKRSYRGPKYRYY